MRPVVLLLQPGVSEQKWHLNLQADIHHSQSSPPCAYTAIHGQPQQNTRHVRQHGINPALWKETVCLATIPPFAMMYIRPVDLQTGKRRHALFVRLVLLRVSRIGKGTSQTTHPLPLPSGEKNKPQNSYIQLMGTRY